MITKARDWQEALSAVCSLRGKRNRKENTQTVLETAQHRTPPKNWHILFPVSLNPVVISEAVEPARTRSAATEAGV